MKDQFVTYEIAKRLKELGFNEECFAVFFDFNTPIFNGPCSVFFKIAAPSGMVINENLDYRTIAAPLWQQAIDWLREKHDLHIVIPKAFYPTKDKYDEVRFCFKIGGCKLKSSSTIFKGVEDGTALHYEQAREAGILKALELIKT